MPIAAAVSGEAGIDRFAELADQLIATQSSSTLIDAWSNATANRSASDPDLDRIVESVRRFWDNGFTDIALVQIGGSSTRRFLEEAARPLLELLREASATGLRQQHRSP